MVQKKLKHFRDRVVEVKMLHIGLGSNLWYPMDVVYVVTGWVWK